MRHKLARRYSQLLRMFCARSDAALVLQVIAGYDRQDTASLDAPVPDYTATMSAPTTSLRLGIPRAYFYEELHPEIQAVMEAALRS